MRITKLFLFLAFSVAPFAHSELVVYGHPDHRDQVGFEWLLENIDEIAKDENVTTLVLEFSSDASAILENLSVQTMEEWEKSGDPSFEAYQKYFSGFRPISTERKFWYEKLLPKIRSINQSRKQKLIVTSIDSQPSDRFELWPAHMFEMKSNGCYLPQSENVGAFVYSYNREWWTKENFKQKILPKIKSGEKVITIYHYMHVVNHIESCLPYWKEDGSWETSWRTSNWLSLLREEMPELEMTSILLDHGKILKKSSITDQESPLGFFQDKSMFHTYLQGMRRWKSQIVAPLFDQVIHVTQ